MYVLIGNSSIKFPNVRDKLMQFWEKLETRERCHSSISTRDSLTCLSVLTYTSILLIYEQD